MSITAYMKPTNYCNVGCTHCYLPESIRAHKFLMSENTLRDSLIFLNEMSYRHGRGFQDQVTLLWHGGEPLTVPVEWYEMAGGLIDEYLPNCMEIIQTSLVPLKDEHIPLIKNRFGSQVGTSIDFSQRQIKGSVERFHKLFMNKVDMARDHDILVIPGMVPTTFEIGREAEIIDWFMERDFRLFNMDRYNAYANAFDDRPSNMQHSLFLIEMFKAVMERMESHGWAPLIAALAGAMTGVLDQSGQDRWGGTCMSDFVVVEPEGGVNNCPDKSTLEDSFSNVSEGYIAFAKSKFRRKWIRHQAVTHKQDFCLKCENQNWCKSGCPITPNGAPEGEDECSGYKTYINYVREYLKSQDNVDRVRAYLNQDIMGKDYMVYNSDKEYEYIN